MDLHRHSAIDNTLVVNPERRLPCILLLDTSQSTAGVHIDQLNRALPIFQRELSQDRIAAKRVEVSLSTFGPIRQLVDFSNIDRIDFPRLAASGDCLIGEAIEHALATVERRKRAYRVAGVAYYRPWIFLISNAQTDRNNWQHAVGMIRDAERAKKASIFIYGGANCRLDILQQLSTLPLAPLPDWTFAYLFSFLSSSLKTASRSLAGNAVVPSSAEFKKLTLSR
jgi:uncharacterized protein YegL